MQPLTLKEREHRDSLLRTERRAIVPLKWFVWLVTSALWIFLVERGVPAPPALALFFFYGVVTIGESVLLYVVHVGRDHARILTLASYLLDVFYVTALIFLNIQTTGWVGDGYTAANDPGAGNFYILYFLLVMRGFALFTTKTEIVLVNALIALLFLLMLRLQQASFAFMTEPAFAIRLVLVWLVLVMIWFIMVILNQQKVDLIGAQEQLLRNERLTQVGELAAGVAHEINNPIGIIIANAEFLMRSTPGDDPRREDLEAILRESARCRDIVQQMLNFASPKPGEWIPVDAKEINDEVINFVFPRGHTEIEVIREYATAPRSFLADPNLIKQALMNIYLNARQAIPADRAGRIVSRIHSGTFSANIVFEIEDNGVGISAEDLPHVFDPFFTRKSKGTGLGLAMTQRIIESFGGRIEMEPVEPHGTRVRLEFAAMRRDPKRTD